MWHINKQQTMLFFFFSTTRKKNKKKIFINFKFCFYGNNKKKVAGKKDATQTWTSGKI